MTTIHPVVRAVLFAAIGCSLGTAIAYTSAYAQTNEIRAIPFTEVKDSAAPDHAWQQHVCQLTGAQCASDAKDSDDLPHLYRARNDSPDHYYAIVPGPRMARFAYDQKQGWRMLENWDFSNYEPVSPVQGDGETPPLKLYPALYPLGPGRWAVAVLSSWHEMYSGGGGSWDNADFVEVKPGGEHAHTASLATVPFSCGKTIRACFTEHEYQHSPHCTEDFEGALRLRFVPSSSSANVDWLATWRESHWPGNLPSSKTEHSVTTVLLHAGQGVAADGALLRDKVSFCEPIN